ncbi:hypothetical protein [Bradyrhizobium sp. CB3481]|uniref:hypothetical protein n=1 Tax=Bradyrhizobium sp. CB3481 TaxID=3039158 RepID=UPI0024B044D3|nr:hypothetical protein [Bradyrhizobium sp. CB3481]WFU19436.1 hypothetical protein QA643_14445 [Bradyrhizobium sp. CB3481]
MSLVALKFVAVGLIARLLLIVAMFVGALAEHWRDLKRRSADVPGPSDGSWCKRAVVKQRIWLPAFAAMLFAAGRSAPCSPAANNPRRGIAI